MSSVVVGEGNLLDSTTEIDMDILSEDDLLKTPPDEQKQGSFINNLLESELLQEPEVNSTCEASLKVSVALSGTEIASKNTTTEVKLDKLADWAKSRSGQINNNQNETVNSLNELIDWSNVKLPGKDLKNDAEKSSVANKWEKKSETVIEKELDNMFEPISMKMYMTKDNQYSKTDVILDAAQKASLESVENDQNSYRCVKEILSKKTNDENSNNFLNKEASHENWTPNVAATTLQEKDNNSYKCVKEILSRNSGNDYSDKDEVLKKFASSSDVQIIPINKEAEMTIGRVNLCKSLLPRKPYDLVKRIEGKDKKTESNCQKFKPVDLSRKDVLRGKKATPMVVPKPSPSPCHDFVQHQIVRVPQYIQPEDPKRSTSNETRRPTALVNPFPPSQLAEGPSKSTQMDDNTTLETGDTVLNGSSQAWSLKSSQVMDTCNNGRRGLVGEKLKKVQKHRPTQTTLTDFFGPKQQQARKPSIAKPNKSVKKKALKAVLEKLGGPTEEAMPSMLNPETSFSVSSFLSGSGGEVSINPLQAPVTDLSVVNRLKRLGTVIELEEEKTEPNSLALLEKMTIEKPQSPLVTALDDRPIYNVGKELTIFKKKPSYAQPILNYVPPPNYSSAPPPPQVSLTLATNNPQICKAPPEPQVSLTYAEPISSSTPEPSLLEPLIDIVETKDDDYLIDGSFVFKMDNFNILDIKNESKTFSCDICSAVYHQGNSLKKHYLRLHISRRYLSKKDMELYSIASENEEVEEIDGIKCIFRCHTCQKCFANKLELKSHLTDHPPVTELNKQKSLKHHKCDICAVTFKWRKVFLKHKKTCKQPQVPPLLIVLPQTQEQPPAPREKYEENKVDIHSSELIDDDVELPKSPEKEETMHHCLYCDETFVSANKKRNHILSIHPYVRKKHNCMFCKQDFTSTYLLFNHLIDEHAEVYFACITCKERFTLPFELHQHNFKKHGSEKLESKPVTIKNGIHYFKCDTCSRMYLKEDTFKEHKCHTEKEKTVKGKIKKVKPVEQPQVKFLSQISLNVRDNLTNYLDGKIENEDSQEEEDRNPSPPSRTFLNFSANFSSTRLSEVPDPPINRSKTPWEKYNFPKTYDGRCGLTSYIKDMSYLDISTQLVMRKNLQSSDASPSKETNSDDVPSVLALERLGAQCAESYGHTPPETGEEQQTLGELSGEWVRERTYICSVCSWETPSLWEMEDHKYEIHPGVHCPQHELVGEERNLSDTIYKRLTPGEPPLRLPFPFNPPPRICNVKCTKCSRGSFESRSDLHAHILACAGVQVQPWLPTPKKKRWKKRRQRRRGLKRNIPSTPHKIQPGLTKLRSKPGDTDTIQKMIANLPPKRSTRRVIGFDEMDLKTRSQSTIQNNRVLRKRPKKSPHTLLKQKGKTVKNKDDNKREEVRKVPAKETDLIDTSAERGDVLSSLRMMPVSTPRDVLLEPRQILNQVLGVSNQEKEFLCFGCGQDLESKLSLKKHQKTCAYFKECGSNSEHKCKDCSTQFDYLLALIEHNCEMPKLEIEKDKSPVNSNEIPVLFPNAQETTIKKQPEVMPRKRLRSTKGEEELPPIFPEPEIIPKKKRIRKSDDAVKTNEAPKVQCGIAEEIDKASDIHISQQETPLQMPVQHTLNQDALTLNEEISALEQEKPKQNIVTVAQTQEKNKEEVAVMLQETLEQNAEAPSENSATVTQNQKKSKEKGEGPALAQQTPSQITETLSLNKVAVIKKHVKAKKKGWSKRRYNRKSMAKKGSGSSPKVEKCLNSVIEETKLELKQMPQEAESMTLPKSELEVFLGVDDIEIQKAAEKKLEEIEKKLQDAAEEKIKKETRLIKEAAARKLLEIEMKLKEEAEIRLKEAHSKEKISDLEEEVTKVRNDIVQVHQSEIEKFKTDMKTLKRTVKGTRRKKSLAKSRRKSTAKNETNNKSPRGVTVNGKKRGRPFGSCVRKGLPPERRSERNSKVEIEQLNEDEILPVIDEPEPKPKPVNVPSVPSLPRTVKRRIRTRENSPDTTTIVVQAEVHPVPEITEVQEIKDTEESCEIEEAKRIKLDDSLDEIDVREPIKFVFDDNIKKKKKKKKKFPIRVKNVKQKRKKIMQKAGKEVVKMAGFSWEVSELEKTPTKSEPTDDTKTELESLETQPELLPALHSESVIPGASLSPDPSPSLGSILDSVNKLLNEPDSSFLPFGMPQYSLEDLQRAMGASDAEMAVLQQLGETSCLPDEPDRTGQDLEWNEGERCIMDLDNQPPPQEIVPNSVPETETPQEEPPSSHPLLLNLPPSYLQSSKFQAFKEKEKIASANSSLLAAYNEKEVVCPSCASRFMGLPALQVHVNTVHTNPQDSTQVTAALTKRAAKNIQGISRLVCFECQQILPTNLMCNHLETTHQLDPSDVTKCANVTGDTNSVPIHGERLKNKMSSAFGDILDKAVNNLLSAKNKPSENNSHGGAAEFLNKLCSVRKKEPNLIKHRLFSSKDLFVKPKVEKNDVDGSEQSKPFSCTVCAQRFVSALARNKHETVTHKAYRPADVYEFNEIDDWRESSPVGSNDGDAEIEWNPTCSDCGLSFSTMVELMKHRTEDHINRRRLSAEGLCSLNSSRAAKRSSSVDTNEKKKTRQKKKVDSKEIGDKHKAEAALKQLAPNKKKPGQ